MRKTLMIVTAATVALVAVACSKKSSSSTPKGLAAGTYTFGTTVITEDQCTLQDLFQGAQVTVTASNNTVTFVGQGGPSTSFTLTSGQTFSFTAPPFNTDWTSTNGENYPKGSILGTGANADFNCKESDLNTQTLVVTGNKSFNFTVVDQFTLVSGSAGACIAANNSAFQFTITQWPCETNETAPATAP